MPKSPRLSVRSSRGSLRIAVAYFRHEATTFATVKAGLNGFAPPSYRGDGLLDACEEIAGFVQFASEHADTQLIPLESFGDVVGGSSVGWITREAFEHYAGLILRDLRATMPVDAVYLALHGAAAVQGLAASEVELARRIRELVGPDVPIAATFDPHGNQTETFLRQANFSLAMKYYPHYDGRLQGERAARLLIRSARGDYRCTTATQRPGIVTPTVLQWTGSEPWSSIIQRALIWEARRKDAYVSVFFGFPWSDVPDVGATVQVMTNADQALADEIADDMNRYFIGRRGELLTTSTLSVTAAVRQAKELMGSKRSPVVLADYSDRAGDATHILAQMIEQDLGNTIVATLRDERVIQALKNSGARAGDAFDFEVGGFVLRPDSGAPVRVRGELAYFDVPASRLSSEASADPVAVVRFGAGNVLVITRHLTQIVEPERMRFGPIQPENFDTWVLKSRVHFRRGFHDTGFAQATLLVDPPGAFLGTVHLQALPYRNLDLTSLYPFSEGLVFGEPPSPQPPFA